MANNSSLTDNFVKALSYYLALSGKSKKEVADGIGIPPTTFSSWSNGKHLPDMDRLQNLATYLGAPVSEFFDFTANTSTPDPLLTELTDIFSELSTEDKLLGSTNSSTQRSNPLGSQSYIGWLFLFILLPVFS